MNEGLIKAAIDIGSNSLRLLIVEFDDAENIKEIKRDLKTTRLAQGIKETGLLREDAVNKTLEVLKSWLDELTYYNVNTVRMAATSAVRDAKNKNEFLEQLKQMGLNCEVIQGMKEAQLTYLGATHQWQGEPLIFDLGGGSMELISQAANIVRSCSLGAVKIFEHFCDKEGRIKDPGTINHYLSTELDTCMPEEELSLLRETIQKGEKTLGVGGTATCLAQIYLKQPVYKKETIHGSFIPTHGLKQLVVQLNAIKMEERVEKYYVPRERSDIIVAGGWLIYYLVEFLGAEGFYVSDNDMLLGLILED